MICSCWSRAATIENFTGQLEDVNTHDAEYEQLCNTDALNLSKNNKFVSLNNNLCTLKSLSSFNSCSFYNLSVQFVVQPSKSSN